MIIGDFCYRDSSDIVPLIGVSASRIVEDEVEYDRVCVRYLDAILHYAHGMPIVLPTVGETSRLYSLLLHLDGLLLTGDTSNIAPYHYGDVAHLPLLLDEARDRTILPLLRPLIATKLPLLGICRGLQELNVAFGGNLFQSLSRELSKHNHCQDLTLSRDLQYFPSHTVTLRQNGFLHRLVNYNQLNVNSLHDQGIRILGDGLVAEAWAPDGLIEAVSVADADFALAVQWHPEWHVATDPVSITLFRAFGEACQRHAQRRKVLLS